MTGLFIPYVTIEVPVTCGLGFLLLPGNFSHQTKRSCTGARISLLKLFGTMAGDPAIKPW